MERPFAAPVASSPEGMGNINAGNCQTEVCQVTQHSGGAERYKVQAGKAKGHPLKPKPDSTSVIRVGKWDEHNMEEGREEKADGKRKTGALSYAIT